MMPISLRIDVPLLRVRAHHPDRLLRVVDLVGLRIVAVAPQPIAAGSPWSRRSCRRTGRSPRPPSRRSACCARRPAPGSPRCRCSCRGTRMQLDRRVVDVDDALDAAGHAVLHVVLLGLAHAIGVKERRAGRKQRQDLPALQNRRRRGRNGAPSLSLAVISMAPSAADHGDRRHPQHSQHRHP